ncbi:MAG: hypothetical protein NC320_01085 [Clostridium sp.]|nr:hypothetical protein [Clostridium sp.]
MTKHECAIVTAYTEVSMLCGDDLKYFYDYLSGIIGRKIYSHEIPMVVSQYKDTVIREDFLALCKNAVDKETDNE